jgi:O-antigen biosynthesis alpha-1,2-mannosyltransferase
MPRFALDATYSVGQQLSGVGVYSRELMRALAAEAPEDRFLYCYRPHRILRSLAESLPSNCQRRLLLDALGVGKCDIFHGLNQRLPRTPFRRRVTTFHDLFVLSGEYSTPEFRERFAAQAREAAAGSDHIIAVSQFTASQITEFLGVDPARITVIHHGIKSRALPALPREPIVLHVGAIQKRKNVAGLVKAFACSPPEWRLVLAGSAGFGAEETLQAIEQSPCRERISVTGYVDEEALAGWYARARILAFPSFDEGFGMPVLEAMAAAVPVITSNRPSMVEVAGEAALMVDPHDQQQLADALARLMASEDLQRELVVRGEKRAAGFSWERAARATLAVYRELL